MVRKTATVLPRLFNRSNDHVPQSSSADSPQTLPSTPPFSNNEVRTIRTGLRARSRKLEDLVSVSQWERVFSMRKRTLMTKALDLEDATGAIVTVTVRVNEDVYYYASSDITQNMLEKSNLLGVNNYHVTKQSLRPGGFSSSNFPSQYLSGDQQLFQTPEKTKVVENTQLSKHQTNNQQISSQSKRNQHFPIQPMTHQQITNQLLINQQKTPEFQSRKQQSSHQPTNQNFNQQSSHTSVIKQATLKHQNK
uniref:MADS-box domain-containing protein n=1 Tax=Ciona savignyi TaxID=51511 RepID=H2Z5N3_CIOSA